MREAILNAIQAGVELLREVLKSIFLPECTNDPEDEL